MRELEKTEQDALEEILKILIGFNVEQAEAILKEIRKLLKERAVIE